MKKFLVVLMAVVMVFAFTSVALAADDVTLKIGNKTVNNDSNVYADVNDGLSVQATPAAEGVTIINTTASGATIKDDAVSFSEAGKYTVTFTVKYTKGDSEEANEESKAFKINFLIGESKTNISSIRVHDAVNKEGRTVGWDKAALTKTGDKYQAYVDKDTAKIKLDIKLASDSQNATWEVVGADNSGYVSGNEITIKVYPENGDTPATYTVVVNKIYDVAECGNLYLNKVKLTPDKRGNYTVNYPYSSKKGAALHFEMTYIGEIDFDIAKSDKDYIDVKSTDKGFDIRFIDTPNGKSFDFDVTISAMNGDKDKEISFTVYLEEAEPVLLDDLEITVGSLKDDLKYTMYPSKFNDKTFEYSVFVPYDSDFKRGIDVFFEADYGKGITAKVGSTNLTRDKDVKVGSVSDGDDETFVIKVTDGTDSSEYAIRVYYADKDASSKANLKSLSAKYGANHKTTAEISPEFSATTYNYSINVPTGTKSVRLTMSAEKNATLVYNGEIFSKTLEVSDLKNGVNTVKVVVMAEDCETTKTYTISINVGSVALTGLSFTTNIGGISVSPAFSANTLNYIANVSNSVNTIYVTPYGAEGANISVFANSGAYQAVNSGKTSSGISLKEGLNEIKVMVTSGSSIKTYCLSVYRQPAATKYQVSSQKVILNGTPKDLYAVNINGNNFIKLRDIAYLLNGTSKQINISFNTSTNAAYLASRTAYTSMDGSENTAIKLANPQISAQSFYLDNASIYPVAYNINRNNFVNLRQLCAVLDIGLTYSSATNTITLNTANSYTAGQ